MIERRDQVVDGEDEEGKEPVEQGQEDLLVEHVHGEDTLHTVLLNASLLADFKVTHCLSWEDSVGDPIAAETNTKAWKCDSESYYLRNSLKKSSRSNPRKTWISTIWAIRFRTNKVFVSR